MDFSKRQFIKISSLALWGTATSAFSIEKGNSSYLNKPVQFVAPYQISYNPAVRKIIDKAYSNSLLSGYYIEQKLGAGGLVAMNYVAQQNSSQPTVLISTPSTSTVNFILKSDLTTVERRSFQPISGMFENVFVLVSGSKGPHSVADWVRTSKNNPNKFTLGSSGMGSVMHLYYLLMEHFLGVSAIHVPYTKGHALAILSGEIDLTFLNVAHALELQKSYDIKFLALTSKLPNVRVLNGIPTLGDFNQNLKLPLITGLLANASMPKESIEYLNEMMNMVLKDRDIRSELQEQGVKLLEPHSSSYYASLLEKEYTFMSKIIKSSHLTSS